MPQVVLTGVMAPILAFAFAPQAIRTRLVWCCNFWPMLIFGPTLHVANLHLSRLWQQRTQRPLHAMIHPLYTAPLILTVWKHFRVLM